MVANFSPQEQFQLENKVENLKRKLHGKTNGVFGGLRKLNKSIMSLALFTLVKYQPTTHNEA